MKIKIISNDPSDGQESISNYIGREYETLSLEKYYDKNIVREMNKTKEVIVFLDHTDKQPSILNENEYIIISE